MANAIVALNTYRIREPNSDRQIQLLKVTTQAGLVGWGESSIATASDLAAAESEWKGREPGQYAAIKKGPLAGALDMAFLDILGKSAKVPVYRLLGGPTRNKARAFTSIGNAELLSQAQHSGYRAFAIQLPAPAARNQGQAYSNQVKRLADQIRTDQGEFILSGAAQLTPGDAGRLAAEFEKMHPLWFDEPCGIANQQTIHKIADESVMPLGFGKDVADPAIFQDLLRQSLVDVVRPDIRHFGITGVRRIAAVAETYYVAVAPNHSGGPVATAAALQLAASLPNFFIQHIPLPASPQARAMRAEIGGRIEDVKDGFCSLPTGPGLGIEINEAALEKYRAS